MIFRTLFSDDSPSPSDHRALEAKVDAINRSQAVIEFALDGTIEAVNDLFAETMGYDRSEIIGRHHRLFVEETYAQSEEYCAFWQKLARGDFHRGRFRRLAKGGREVWLQATYNPILDADGAPVGVVKFATDITERTRQAAHFRSRIEAIDRSQAVIEFALDGTIETANANFLAFTGYSLDEIQGRHHRMFCDPSYARSPEYHTFWERLRRGEFHSDRFRRVVKGGHEVWIQATYNPILDADGTPIRVIKFATDVTDQVRSEQRLQRGVAMMLDMISEVAASARTIADETEVLAASSQEQSVQSQEVAAAVEEMATTVFENAQSNTRAAELAATSGRAASEGAEVVTNTVDKIQQIAAVVSNGTRIIERLGSSSQRIGEIVATIEDIADQTNLLALNAAIESARAGEHGRGFAVVADEVRKLAERTTRATTEIAEMIETVQGESTAAVEAMREGESEVETGIALADRAGKALGQIVTGTSETGDMISLIAAASEEQSTTSEQISRSVEAISSEAQHSARSIDQIARSVSGLQRLTEDLRHQVHTLGDRFDHGEASPTAPAQATARPSGDGSSAPTPTFSVT